MRVSVLTPKQRYKLALQLFQPSKFIGVYYEPKTRTIRKIVNAGMDWELDDPSHLENGNERLKLLKIPRGDAPLGDMSIGSCAAVQAEAERILSKKS